MPSDRVPELDDSTNYADWKLRVENWTLYTKTEKSKQAAALIGHMRGRPERAAIQMNVKNFCKDDGVTDLLTELDKLYLPDETQQIFNTLDSFLQYRRPPSATMEEYCREFQRRNRRLEQITKKKMFDDGVLAYFLLQNSNLDETNRKLVRATVSKLELAGVETALKRTFGQGSAPAEFIKNESGPGLTFIKQEGVYYGASAQCSSSETDHSGYCSSASERGKSRVKTPSSTSDDEDNRDYRAFYQERRSGSPRKYFRKPSRDRNFPEPYQKRQGSSSRKYESPAKKSRSPKNNFRGRRKGCFNCDAEDHKVADCPLKGKDTRKQFFQSFVNINEDQTFLNETYSGALLDSGASATVCGRKWLEAFESTLTPTEKNELGEEVCFQSFKFGDGDPIISYLKKNIPVTICGEDIMLLTYVVDSDVPLLLSRATMKKMGCTLDFVRDEISVFGGKEKLIITRSGHMIIPFKGRAERLKTDDLCETDTSSTYVVKDGDPKKTAEHLHRYFAHSSAQKIKDVVRESSVVGKEEVCANLDKIEKSCDQCIKRKSKQIPARKVALPAGSKFNERVAMDLKYLDSGALILHAIDTVTRYAMAIEVKSKESGEILTKLFRIWISVFGRPDQFLSDNGGEFVNQEFNEMCEKFDITVSTSPAESPWCNGVIERHNGILGKMIDSTMEETGCNLETAICWCVNAKNTLCNVQGFSPNQLVFGSNPSTPGLLDDKLKLSTLNTETSSKLVADNMNARNAARQKYLQLENDACIKKALTQRVYEGRNKTYHTGDSVYFKKEKQKTWNGPALVVGQLGNVVIVKQGGLIYRVHPCKIVLKHEADNQVNGSASVTDVAPQKPNQDVREQRSVRFSLPQDSDSDSDEDLPIVVEDLSLGQSSGNQSQLMDKDLGNQSQVADKDLGNQSQSSDRDQRPVSHGNQSQLIDQAPTSAGNQSHAQDPSSDSERQPNTWTTVTKTSGKINLKKDDVVRYRASPSDDWTSGVVMSRAGKATGKHKNEFNIIVEEEDNPVNVHLDQVTVEKQSIYHLVTDSQEIKDPAVLKAKEAEIKRFEEFGVFDEVKDQGQPTVSSRWVITSKSEGNYKARLVARGFQEETENDCDAPTADRISKRLLFTIAVCQNWEIRTLDITSAFLQSDELVRDVYVKPPQDIRRKGIIWKLKKPLYGLGDSARLWYETLRNKLIEIGCKISILDQSVFRYYDEKNNLIGVLVSHVDDLLYAGNSKFHRECMKQVLATFKISRLHTKDFTYLGWSIGQNKGHITVDQRQYGLDIKPTKLPRNSDKERTLSETEKKAYQTTLGKLLWLSSQTRPDLSYDTMELSTYTNSAKVKHLSVMNKVIKKVQYGPQQIRFNAMDLTRGDIKVIFFSDASLGNLPNKIDSGGGYLVFISDGENANLVAWSSNKIKRTVHSVFGAETYGCVAGIAAAIYVRQILSEVLYNDARKTVIPIVGYIDSNQLAQQIRSTKQASDMRMRLDIAGIRQTVNSGEVESITWIPTKNMLADPLTKKDADIRLLKNVVEKGRFC